MGATIGRFELLGLIAKGGMAELYIARQRGLEGFEKLVVIKKLLPNLADDPRIVSMLLNEARLAARLSHPNVVQIYDLGLHEGGYYIAMEYIQGENIGSIIRRCLDRKQVLPQNYAVEIARQVCQGLHYAHTKADVLGQPLYIVHRDISPDNVVVSFDGVAKVVDFGIARTREYVGQTKPGMVRGKYSYMSPEQCRSQELDARSDLFSLGILLWEMCTGRRLYKQPNPFLGMKAIVKEPVLPPRQVNPDIPSDLEEIILKALMKDRSKRFQSAADMGQALDKALRESHMEASSMSLGVFMKSLFKDKREKLQLLYQGLLRGERVESEAFVTVRPADPSLVNSPRNGDPGKNASIEFSSAERPSTRSFTTPNEKELVKLRRLLLFLAVALFVSLVGNLVVFYLMDKG